MSLAEIIWESLKMNSVASIKILWFELATTLKPQIVDLAKASLTDFTSSLLYETALYL